MHILITDDDLTTRNMLSGFLKKMGHHVVEACDGKEAWNILQRGDILQLAIIDWLMPELDGLAVVKRARAHLNHRLLYIIMLTMKSDKTDIVEALNAGADEYLTKPVDFNELHARVNVGCRIIEMSARLDEQVKKLKTALDHIKTLQGIIPICSYCRKVRTDHGAWKKLETYILQHSEAQFSHGICPSCLKIYDPESDTTDYEY